MRPRTAVRADGCWRIKTACATKSTALGVANSMFGRIANCGEIYIRARRGYRALLPWYALPPLFTKQ